MTNEETYHDEDEATDNQPRRGELCDIDAIESKALRKVARRWREAGLDIEAGNTLAGDYVSHLNSGAKVYVSYGQYVVHGPDGESTFDAARDAAQYAYGITEEVKRVTRYADFPDELQRLIDELEQEGFGIVYGTTGGEPAQPAFIAEKDETTVHVEDWTQTWALTCRGPDRPDFDDTWAYPDRVRGEVWEWLQDYGD